MKALVLAPFDSLALDKLKSNKIEVLYESWIDTHRLVSPEELVERIQAENISILVIEADFIFAEVFTEARKLRFVGVCRSTVNNVDIESATENSVLVVNTPGRNAIAVAELTIGLILSLARRLPDAHYMVRSGQWLDPVAPYISLRGSELQGKIAGIIGLGTIGYEVAKRLRAFEMTILAFDPFVELKKAREINAQLVDLDELMSRSDFITIHCPVSPQTEGLISAQRISLMKPTAYLTNTAGTAIVEEKAIVEALQHRRIAGAAFDAFDTHPISSLSPLLKLDNVILTPHIGGATAETIKRYSWMIVADIERFIRGQCPKNLLNPQVWGKNV